MEEAINCASEDTREPKIMSPGETIVKLQAAALNHIDVWTRLGVTGMAIPMPHILGADGARYRDSSSTRRQRVKHG